MAQLSKMDMVHPLSDSRLFFRIYHGDQNYSKLIQLKLGFRFSFEIPYYGIQHQYLPPLGNTNIISGLFEIWPVTPGKHNTETDLPNNTGLIL